MSIRMKKGLLFVATLLLLAGCKKNQEFDATGTFEAKEVTISAETSGKVLSLDLEESYSLRMPTAVPTTILHWHFNQGSTGHAPKFILLMAMLCRNGNGKTDILSSVSRCLKVSAMTSI